jgi:hypothetical protein
MAVTLIVLRTGEQLLSDAHPETNANGVDGFLVKKPAILVPAGEKGIGLAPWLPYTKAASGVFIKNDSISFTVDPVDELKNHYTGSFVNGLVVPSNEVATPQLQLSE